MEAGKVTNNSMGVSDSMYADFTYGLTTSKRRIDIGKVLFGRSSKTNRQGVVFFNNNGSVVARLGSTESELKNTLKILEMYKDSYNTNIKTALGVALDELLTSEDENAIKSIVLISDGVSFSILSKYNGTVDCYYATDIVIKLTKALVINDKLTRSL